MSDKANATQAVLNFVTEWNAWENELRKWCPWESELKKLRGPLSDSTRLKLLSMQLDVLTKHCTIKERVGVDGSLAYKPGPLPYLDIIEENVTNVDLSVDGNTAFVDVKHGAWFRRFIVIKTANKWLIDRVDIYIGGSFEEFSIGF